jgi:hypothetical protein
MKNKYFYSFVGTGCLFSYLIDKRWPDALVSFIRLPKGYYHSDRLSSYHYRLLNLTDMRRTIQRWQGVGRSIGPALTGQTGKKNALEHPSFGLEERRRTTRNSTEFL